MQSKVQDMNQPWEGSVFSRRLLSMSLAVGVSIVIFWGISRTQNVGVQEPLPEIDDLRAFIIAPPPPPPPTLAAKEPPPPSPLDIDPVPEPEGLSVTSIPLEAAPMSRPEVNPDLSLDLSTFRPRSDINANNPDYIYTKNMVDRPPIPVYRKKMDEVPPSIMQRVDIPKVSLMFVINKDGSVENVRVLGSADSEFDALVMQTVKFWRFKPAMKDGKPVRCWGKTRFTVHQRSSRSRFTLD